MKRLLILGSVVLLGFAATASAQTPGPVNFRAQNAVGPAGPNFVDADGDGICDNFQSGVRAGKAIGPRDGSGARFGPGDGSGFGMGPRDGSGFGRGPRDGGGLCDGTGPKGQARPARGGQGARR
jgi:hypothetical protein